jgi:quinohemoprotein ethanol dehydrogenase
MQAPKNGFFYVLDAATGDFISAEKFGQVTWAKGIDPKTGRPIVDAGVADYWTEGEPKIVMPGSQGAHNWPPMSYNPNTGLVYIPQQVTLEHFNPLEKAKPIQTAVPNLGMVTPVVPETQEQIAELAQLYRGNLVAWDPVKQEARWTQPYDHIHNSGTLSTGGNLVFQGTADGWVVAYSADRGEKLWEQEVSSGVVAGPVSYEVDGEQYVAFNVGWGGAFAITFGALSQLTNVVPDSRLYVFKLDGKAEMPKVTRRTMKPPSPPEMTASADQLATGKELFNNHCGVCHGLSAIGSGILPDLRYLSAEQHELFMPTVYGGLRSHLGMPPFGNILPQEDVEAIHQYIIKRSHDLRTEMPGKQTAAAER